MYLIITKSFPPEKGGMQNLMGGLSETLSKYKMIKVITDYNENGYNYDQQFSFTIERVKGIKLLRKYRKALHANNFLKNNNNVSCVIADHWKSLELIKTDKKKICLIHSKEINHDRGSRENKRSLKVLNEVDYVVSNSQFTKDLAIEKGVKPEIIKIINPGVDPRKDIDKKYISDAEKLLENKKPRLVTVSRFDKRKNHEKVIMAVRNLKQIYPNIMYVCIGYGEEEKNIKSLIKELSLENHVIILNQISQEYKNAILSKSDVFVMPSVIHKKSIEGFGISFVEAAQYGVPSIGGKDGGASDAIAHNETGYICDGNSLDEIYSSVEKILQNNLHKQLGSKAKTFAKKFEWNNIIKDYLNIL